MNALREECQQLRDELIALRREFHRAPELGLHEYHTAARIVTPTVPAGRSDAVCSPKTRCAPSSMPAAMSGLAP